MRLSYKNKRNTFEELEQRKENNPHKLIFARLNKYTNFKSFSHTPIGNNFN